LSALCQRGLGVFRDPRTRDHGPLTTPKMLLFVTLIIYLLLPKVHHHIISFCYVTYVFKWVTFKEAWSRFRVT